MAVHVQSDYAKLLEETLGTGSANSRILAFKNKVKLLQISHAPRNALHSFLVCLALTIHLPPRATVILNLRMTQAPAPPEGHINQLASLYTQNAGNRPAKKTFRAVPSAPERILDAPDLVDDYYLNLLDWSSTNVVCISLHSKAAASD